MNFARTLLLAGLAASPAWAGQVRTTLVVDANTTPVVADSNASGFYASDGLLYFTARQSDVGRQLFASDGVSPQVRLVHDFTADGQLSDPYVLGRIGNRLIVSTKDVTLEITGADRHVVLALDLDTGGTTRLVEFDAQYNMYTWRIDRVGEVPGQVLFTDLVDGTVWSTDGTAQGTAQRYAPSPLDNAVSSRHACSLGDRVVFAGRSGAQRVIWSSDGTAQGSQAVTAIAESGYPDSAIRAGNACYFVINRSTGWALWRSDGTVAGTGLVTTGSESPYGGLAALGNVAYVLASGNARVTLVRSDWPEPVLDRAGRAGDIAAAGGRLAFTYFENFSGDGNVLVSDGTTAGTRVAMLDGVPLVAGGNVIAAGDRFYASNGDTLYVVDPLTAQAVSLGNQPGFRSRWDVASLGALAFDAVDDGVHGNELWRSDGTAAGTRLLHDIAQLNADGVVAPYSGAIVRDGTVFFANTVYTPDGVRRPLWRTDGTPSGTRALPYPTGHHVVSIAAFNDGIVFSTVSPDEPSARLYWTSRDFATTTTIWDPLVGYAVSASTDGNAAVFHCATPASSEASLCGLRKPDLQASVLVPGGNPAGGTNGLVGGIGAVVVAQFNGRLWRSDGTIPGTFEIAPGVAFTRVDPSTAGVTAGGALVFFACLGPNASDCGLHRSDGTAAGTYRLAALQLEQITTMAALGQRAVFGTFSGALWVTDGSVTGTQLLSTDVGTAYEGMASIGTHVHFIARRSQPDEIAYVVSDGTPAGTRRVLPPEGFYPGDGALLVVDANTVVFSCWGADTGYELCRVDGDGNGWTLAADIAPGRRSSSPRRLARAGNIAYFTADDGTRGSELWRVEPFVDAIFATGFQP